MFEDFGAKNDIDRFCIAYTEVYGKSFLSRMLALRPLDDESPLYIGLFLDLNSNASAVVHEDVLEMLKPLDLKYHRLRTGLSTMGGFYLKTPFNHYKSLFLQDASDYPCAFTEYETLIKVDAREFSPDLSDISKYYLVQGLSVTGTRDKPELMPIPNDPNALNFFLRGVLCPNNHHLYEILKGED